MLPALLTFFYYVISVLRFDVLIKSDVTKVT